MDENQRGRNEREEKEETRREKKAKGKNIEKLMRGERKEETMQYWKIK